MEVESVDQGEKDEKKEQQIEEVEQEAEESERGRPSTPKWWRPPVPPETYQWEEVRRQRQKGGYPWTHLDKDEEIDVDDYLDENLYEPVNPPPLYGNESYLSKDLQQVPQAEERMIDIPPELEILTSEGLDGLDKPDPHDHGFDGDREWQNVTSDDEQGPQNKSNFTAGIRSKPGDPPRSTTPKQVGFSPDTITHESPDDADQEVPEEMDADAEGASCGAGCTSGGSHGRRKTPFDILKSKACGAADQMKQRLKSVIPPRPKMSQKAKKRRKAKQEQGEEGELEGGAEDAEAGEPTEEAEQIEEQMEVTEEKPLEEAASEEPEAELKDDEKRKKAEEKEERERKKTEEKLAKQQAAEEAKKAKLEEKLAKAREAEEQRQAKAEEERRKQEEAKKAEEERKAAEKAAKEEEAKKAAEAKKIEDERKAAEKKVKEEEARKAAEAKKIEDERKAAEKKAKAEEAKKIAEAKKAEEAARKAEEDAKKAAEKAAKEEARKAAAAAKEEARKAAEAAKEEERKAAEAIKEEERKVAEAAAAEAAAKAAELGLVEETPQTSEEPAEGEKGDAAEGQGEEGEEEAMEVPRPQTPSGTTKRRYIKQRKNPLAAIPNPIASLRNQVEDFRNKLKRSRTPPRRQAQRKQRRSRSADASRSPPREPGEETEAVEGEQKEEETPMEVQTEEPTTSQKPVAEPPAASQSQEPEAATESVEQVAEAEEEAEEAQHEEGKSAKGTKRRQPAAKEKLDKIGHTLKGVGAKSIGIASQAGKEVGQIMKVVGKGAQKLGTKVNEKCQSAMVEMKAKQESSKKSTPAGSIVDTSEEVAAPAAEPEPPAPPPKRTFRFKRRNESQEEADEMEMEREEQEHFYENEQGAGREQDRKLLGRANRDWESPMDRAGSRDASEEPASGNISSRDSPPGSSLASSNVAHVRRPGVLEEIDSDEFFLRERGISEGEDEEEVNRFLVEELRQAFRPTMSNALAGFDRDQRPPTPPRPERTPRKPPRKDRENVAPTSFQTFPPERPKRKGPQGYVSKFMEQEGGEEEDMGSNEEVRGSSDDMKEDIEGDEGFQQLKDKLSEIDHDIEGDEGPFEEAPHSQVSEEYEDDGRYEPISDGPVKPERTKRKKPKRPPTPPSFYYNTIAATEWLQELEHQIDTGAEPAAPLRKRRGSGRSGGSASLPPTTLEVTGTDERHVQDEQLSERQHAQSATPSAQSEAAASGSAVGDYVDEAGYAIVQKDRDVPRTIPRKKKKRAADSNERGALLQAQGAQAPFSSLPRFAAASDGPPSRPQRTYSTVRPRRPPRSKSGSRTSLDKVSQSPLPRRDAGDESRPSTAIGIMQGRPLPPPPRPTRSPAPNNETDPNSIETSLGVRHYANFDDIEPQQVEELFIRASHVPTIGERSVPPPPPRPIEVDTACQTDPVPEDEFILGISPPESPVLDSSRIRTASSRLQGQETQTGERRGSPSQQTTTAGDVSSSFQTPPSQSPCSNQTQPPDQIFPPNPSPTFSFPTRLHLEQLEVDFLRVNDLSAQSIRVENLQAGQLEVNALNATGPLCVSRIQTQSLSSEEVTCSRLTSNTIDLPSVPPQPFYQLSSPDELAKLGSEHELCLKTEEHEEKENESACPPEFFDSVHNLMGYVDSTNDLKSSHVAEKVEDKQLNVMGSASETEPSKPKKKDASVGTRSRYTATPQTNVPQQQLNDLNQESARKTQTEPEKQSEEIQVKQQFLVTRAPEPVVSPRAPALEPSPEPTSTSTVVPETEESEQPAEETVIRGSYTLPYSYVDLQGPPTPLKRTGSTKSSQSPPSQSSPTASLSRVESQSLGQTSVEAQGDVLSVKLSIPVERGSTGQSSLAPRSTPPTTRPQHLSNSARLPDSAISRADSLKREAQRQVPPKETKPSTPPKEIKSSTPPQAPSPPPRSLEPRRQSSDGEESIYGVSARLGRAVLRFTMRALQSMADYIESASSDDPHKAEQQRANMQVLLCLLLVLVVGLILATAGTGEPYITPRWEFLMPPPDL